VAGQLGRGFIIDRVNGRAIQSIADLRAVLDALRPGQVVSMTGHYDDGTSTIVNFRVRG